MIDPRALAALLAASVVLGGDVDRKIVGLLTERQGGLHLPERDCAVGQWRTAGDAQRGGAECSERCQRAKEALRLIVVALEAIAEQQAAPAQMPLLEAG